MKQGRGFRESCGRIFVGSVKSLSGLRFRSTFYADSVAEVCVASVGPAELPVGRMAWKFERWTSRISPRIPRGEASLVSRF